MNIQYLAVISANPVEVCRFVFFFLFKEIITAKVQPTGLKTTIKLSCTTFKACNSIQKSSFQSQRLILLYCCCVVKQIKLHR